MSHKNNTIDSYKTSSRQEAAKFILPFVLGFIVALIIWFVWLFPQYEGEDEVDVNFVMSVLFLIILLVESTIAVIIIYLTYKNKVVKMRPKSSYKIENIKDFLIAQEQYRNGNYEYETIKSEEDIIKAHENGKKIVFTARKTEEKVIMWIGMVFLTIGLIISIILATMISGIQFKIITFIAGNSVFGSIGAAFFLPNFIKLRRLPRSFFVLDKQGIVYRRIWGGIKAYYWKELDLKIYSVKTTMRTLAVLKTEFPPSVEIHVILPNEAILKFNLEKYHLDEFLSFEKLRRDLKSNVELSKAQKYFIAVEKRKHTLYLVGMTFKHYFNYGKKELENNSD